jgi:hypothetical protein
MARRILLVGGMVAISAKKMSEARAKQIEEHPGVPPEELEDDDPRPFVAWLTATRSQLYDSWREGDDERLAGDKGL